MVFCKECRRKVEDCPHFVFPISARRISVFDPKIETLAYEKQRGILEITFKSGQAWQLFDVPPAIYAELRDTTISSFLKFIAQRYKAAPVKTGLYAIRVPESEKCSNCKAGMTVRHRIDNAFDRAIRILWECVPCRQTYWKDYGNSMARDKKGKWH
jgi:hypothetical protein